ncbi:conserved hypothetical protein, partial [Ricinus communis]
RGDRGDGDRLLLGDRARAAGRGDRAHLHCPADRARPCRDLPEGEDRRALDPRLAARAGRSRHHPGRPAGRAAPARFGARHGGGARLGGVLRSQPRHRAPPGAAGRADRDRLLPELVHPRPVRAAGALAAGDSGGGAMAAGRARRRAGDHVAAAAFLGLCAGGSAGAAHGRIYRLCLGSDHGLAVLPRAAYAGYHRRHLADRRGMLDGGAQSARHRRARSGARTVMIAIRTATPDDVPLILDLVRELAVYEREPDAVVATEAMLHDALFARRVAESLIAELDGRPVGFALFFHNFSTWTGKPGIYLEDLYVTPGARGAGAGKALLRHLAGIALDRDCGRFEWAVLDWNTPAIDFYRAMGAQAMAEWTVQRVTGDALVALAGR